MDYNIHLDDPFDILPDEIVLHIMSFFEEKERFWIFGLVSERFFGLFSRQDLEMHIDDNSDMTRKTNLVLDLKRLSMNIENVFVRLKATKTKVNKFNQSDTRHSYTLTINVGNWLKENPQVMDTIKTIVDKCQRLRLIYFDYLIHRVDEILEYVTGGQPNLMYLYLDNCYSNDCYI